MLKWSSWGSRQAAQMGFDGRVAGWALPRVTHRPLSSLYCLVQTLWRLITGSGEGVGSLCPFSISGGLGGMGLSRYQLGGINENSALIHWLNQWQVNTISSPRVKARYVWFHETDDMVSSAKVMVNRTDGNGSSWSTTQPPKQALGHRPLMLLMVHKIPVSMFNRNCVHVHFPEKWLTARAIFIHILQLLS